MTRDKLEWFILTDKYHLLRENESYLLYQAKRSYYYLKALIRRIK